jgi:hypothetical protein
MQECNPSEQVKCNKHKKRAARLGCLFLFGLPVELLNSKKTQSVIKNDRQSM